VEMRASFRQPGELTVKFLELLVLDPSSKTETFSAIVWRSRSAQGISAGTLPARSSPPQYLLKVRTLQRYSRYSI
jgi:hypothetical protein